jgi:PAS domain S-box-containing protein
VNVSDDVFAPFDLESAWAPLLIVTRDDGKVRRANGLAEKLFGYERGEMEGVVVEALMPEHVRERHELHRQEYAAAESPRARQMGVGLKVTALRKDGSTFLAEVSLSPLRFNGSFFVVVGIRALDARDPIQANLDHVQRIIDRIQGMLEKIRE